MHEIKIDMQNLDLVKNLLTEFANLLNEECLPKELRYKYDKIIENILFNEEE